LAGLWFDAFRVRGVAGVAGGRCYTDDRWSGPFEVARYAYSGWGEQDLLAAELDGGTGQHGAEEGYLRLCEQLCWGEGRARCALAGGYVG